MIKEMVYWLWGNFKSHINNVSAHHTDHQTASAEDAEFKSVNIPPGEAYKQNSVNILTTKTIANTFIGIDTGFFTTGNYNSFIGAYAGHFNTTGNRNSFICTYAGHFNTTGNYNSFIGYAAGYENITGNYNSFIGYTAGFKNTTGYHNSFIGPYAGHFNTIGNYNSFIGSYAGLKNTTGDYNSFIGYAAGHENTTGNRNSFIGCEAGYNEVGSNKLYIANSNTVTPLIWGDFANNKVGIHMKPDVAKFGVAGIIEYADNAAAVTAGLSVGEFYRTGDILKIVHA